MIFNEIFRKGVAYDNNKSHKKIGLHLLFEKHNFGKTSEREVKLMPLSRFLFCYVLLTGCISCYACEIIVLIFRLCKI